ncbi:4Fe-4S dicluster domain-containing protein [Halomonas sp. LR5S13]|uniref:4Fe-4S dicluster domain-containing protein n=1 Tax=Halomonas rhizosphaerae TaxID=3043296 RepID=UPI0024A8D9B4|nr:4Fe-4S dicluster domain-containing protein [Halomonas rhizosphaerae]MDI5919795.1 4Fe-4S dicluster domain-containing protein [Halomonas rhizosphaerae]
MKVRHFLAREHLQSLLDRLVEAGYEVIGPRVRDHAILFEPLTTVAQLPVGIIDDQAPGHYRLERTDSGRVFDWATGPQAIKPLTFAPRETLWRSERQPDGRLVFREQPPEAQPTAVIGVRACDLAALAVHDRHFLHDAHPDPLYRERRQNLFLVAVNCMRSAATCFCTATGDGPRAQHGFDLALSELDDGFVVEAHTQEGQAILDTLETTLASHDQLEQVEAGVERATRQQTRRLPDGSLPEMLQAAVAHPHWQSLNDRCLTCGNCTAVCPTCFCQTHVDELSLDGQTASHGRQWGSCFDPDHSYIHGTVIRAERPQRYRQWLTHKFGTWVEQYGRSGCVGCGRCIAWCPVGIDVTEELAALSRAPDDALSIAPDDALSKAPGDAPPKAPDGEDPP